LVLLIARQNQNGGLIQDGEENIFIFHIIFDFVAWQH
jgi:hypothetical protein